MDFAELEFKVSNCTKCSLHEYRTKVVVGSGDPHAKILLVGEAPGKNEDLQGLPFVGAAGKFLDELLASISLSRDRVYITNTLKCRPPQNRDPLPEELVACKPWLDLQFEVIKPKVVVSLGRFSMKYFQERFGLPQENISKVHGLVFPINTLFWSGYFVPMYHPAAGLYNGGTKQKIIEDWAKFGDFLSEKKLV